MVAEIYLLRHGQTQFNAERRLQGQCNSPLTELGQRQAFAMGKALAQQLGANAAQWQFVSSPLGRTRQTSELVCQGMGISTANVTYDARVQEVGLGDWEHEQIEQIVNRHPAFAARNDWYLEAPNGETLVQVQQRLREWLADYQGKQLIVISHGLTGMILKALLMQQDDEQIWLQERPQDALFHYKDQQLTKIAVDARYLHAAEAVPTLSANG